MMDTSRAIALSLVLCASAASVAHAQRAPRARPAKLLPRYAISLIEPWLSSSGYDVNLFGMVAGSSGTAVLWTDVGTLVPIPPPAGTVFPFAFGLNDTGRVVGHATVSSDITAAWVWDPVLGTRDLRALGVPRASTAAAINESDQIVGKRLASNYIAYRFDLDSGMRPQ